jgi:putative oxidoreductase
MPKYVYTAARLILGLIYFVFGGMGLAMAFGLLQLTPPPMPPAAEAYMTGIMATGYFFPLLKVTEVACGLCLLTGVAAPAALVIIAPVTLHIILHHLCLTPGLNNAILPLIMGLAQVLAMAGFWSLYAPLFGKR